MCELQLHHSKNVLFEILENLSMLHDIMYRDYVHRSIDQQLFFFMECCYTETRSLCYGLSFDLQDPGWTKIVKIYNMITEQKHITKQKHDGFNRTYIAFIYIKNCLNTSNAIWRDLVPPNKILLCFDFFFFLPCMHFAHSIGAADKALVFKNGDNDLFSIWHNRISGFQGRLWSWKTYLLIFYFNMLW